MDGQITAGLAPSSTPPPASQTPLPDLPCPPPLSPPYSLPPIEQAYLADGALPKNPIHKLGRRSRFSSDYDLVLIREVVAAKAHIAPNGEVRERFQIAASKSNATKRLCNVVTWKAVQDRYKRLQGRFDKYDNIESRISGVGGEMGEAEELLSTMREVRVELEGQCNAKQKRAMDEDDRKEWLRAIIRQRATERAPSRRGKDSGTGATVVDEDGEGECEGEDASMIGSARSSAKKRKRGLAAFSTMEDESGAFIAALQNADERQNELEAERLQLDRDRFEAEKADREFDREERRKDREAAREMDLEKFRIKINVLQQSKGSGSGS